MYAGRSQKRPHTVLTALIMVLLMTCLGIAYERSVDCRIGRLVGLDTLGVVGSARSTA